MVSLNPLTMVLDIFCSLPNALKFIAAFLMAFINVPCIISSFIPLLLIFGFAVPPTNYFNHDPNHADPKSKNWNMAAGWAFGIYYIITLLWVFGNMIFGCKINENIDPTMLASMKTVSVLK